MLRCEVEAARGAYQEALDALHHQRLVVGRIEAILASKTHAPALSRDKGSQTDTPIDESEGVFLASTQLHAKILRMIMRRRAFESAAQRDVDQLQLSVEALRLEVADSVPADEIVNGILSA